MDINVGGDQLRALQIFLIALLVPLSAISYVSNGIPVRQAIIVLQTLAVAQASLLGIVVSVGLLSIQISANQFTPLIARLYEEESFLSPIILFFGSSILYDLLGILAIPWIQSAQWATSQLQVKMIISLILSLGIGIALLSFTYIFTTKDMVLRYLNPEPLLNRLTQRVTLEDYIEYHELTKTDKTLRRNPVLEIYEIGRKALEENDNHTARIAVQSLNEATHKILTEYNEFDDSEEIEVRLRFKELFEYWELLSDAAIKKGLDSTIEVLSSGLAERSIEAAENNFLEVTSVSLAALETLYQKSLEEKRLEKVYNNGFSRVIEKCIEGENWEIASLVISYEFRFLRKVFKEQSKEEVTYADLVHQQILASVRENWSRILDLDSEAFDTGGKRDLHCKYKDHTVSLLGLYLGIQEEGIEASAHELEGVIESIAKTAAQQELQKEVKNLTRLLIEFHIFTGRESDLTGAKIARIRQSGGDKGVERAFNQILEYEYRTEEELEREKDEIALKGVMPTINDQAYPNQISGQPKLNTVNGFRTVVETLRKQSLESLSQDG